MRPPSQFQLKLRPPYPTTETQRQRRPYNPVCSKQTGCGATCETPERARNRYL